MWPQLDAMRNSMANNLAIAWWITASPGGASSSDHFGVG
jgi:hypothetical protein